MVGINVPIPVPAAAYSFGGWKSSMFGQRLGRSGPKSVNSVITSLGDRLVWTVNRVVAMAQVLRSTPTITARCWP
jgi:hypothetical protein